MYDNDSAFTIDMRNARRMKVWSRICIELNFTPALWEND